ncbi:MAG: hypothetical protein OXC40_03030 [Proteobacteria bacterium]|nr:hypothetical protein [Pseudomonadota bacterium]
MNPITTRITHILFLLLVVTSCRMLPFEDQEDRYALQALFDGQHLLRLKQIDDRGTRFRFEVCPLANNTTRIIEEYCVAALQAQSGADINFSLETIEQSHLIQKEQQRANIFHSSWLKYRQQMAELNPTALALTLGGGIVLTDLGIYAARLAGHESQLNQYFKQLGVRSTDEAAQELNEIARQLESLGWNPKWMDFGPTITEREIRSWQSSPNKRMIIENLFSEKFDQTYGDDIRLRSLDGAGEYLEGILPVVRDFVRKNSVKSLINESYYNRFLHYYQMKYHLPDYYRSIVDFQAYRVRASHRLEQAFINNPMDILSELELLVKDRGAVKSYLSSEILGKLNRWEMLRNVVVANQPSKASWVAGKTGSLMKRISVVSLATTGAMLAFLALEKNNDSSEEDVLSEQIPLPRISDKLVMLNNPQQWDALWRHEAGANQFIDQVTPVLKAFVYYGDLMLDGGGDIASYCLPEVISHQSYAKVCYGVVSAVKAQGDKTAAPFKQISSVPLSAPRD